MDIRLNGKCSVCGGGPGEGLTVSSSQSVEVGEELTVSSSQSVEVGRERG